MGVRISSSSRASRRVFCSSAGKVEVIEYSDLPMDLQRERLPDGSLRFVAGSIAIHMIGIDFIDRLANDPSFALPYHRAEKKIPCVDPTTGAAITPTSNNGVKLEQFVFDAISTCKSSIVYETDRAEEFGPIKNATGVDSVESSKALQTARAASWLEACGVSVPRKPDGSPEREKLAHALEAIETLGEAVTRAAKSLGYELPTEPQG